MLTDIVLVHGHQRDHFLYPQLTSLIDTQPDCNCDCHGHAVRILVVLDSSDVDVCRAFEEQVDRVKRYIHDNARSDMWSIELWDRARQQRALTPWVEAHDPFFTDASTKRMGGVRAMQNVSQAIADITAGDVEDIVVHRLDDDIFPYCLDSTGDGGYEIARIDHFLCAKWRALAVPGVRIVGSYYTLDSPSLITDLFEVVEAIHTLIEAITPEACREACFDWPRVAARLYVYGAPETIRLSDVPSDLASFLNLSHLTETGSVPDVLAWIARSLDLFDIGVNRFEYNIDRFARETGWFGPRTYLPGGCVSMRNDVRMAPFPNFGDQDLLWTYLEHLRRGGVAGDFSVLHVKTPVGRDGLFTTLRNRSESAVRSSFRQTLAMQELMGRRFDRAGTLRPDLQEFGGFGRGIVDRTETRLRECLDRLQQFTHVEGRVHSCSDQVAARLRVLLEAYPAVKHRYGQQGAAVPADAVAPLLDAWLASEPRWWEVRTRLRRRHHRR